MRMKGKQNSFYGEFVCKIYELERVVYEANGSSLEKKLVYKRELNGEELLKLLYSKPDRVLNSCDVVCELKHKNTNYYIEPFQMTLYGSEDGYIWKKGGKQTITKRTVKRNNIAKLILDGNGNRNNTYNFVKEMVFLPLQDKVAEEQRKEMQELMDDMTNKLQNIIDKR